MVHFILLIFLVHCYYGTLIFIIVLLETVIITHVSLILTVHVSSCSGNTAPFSASLALIFSEVCIAVSIVF